MKEPDDQRLCDYIFGLLDAAGVEQVESFIEQSASWKERHQELELIFGSLEIVQDDFMSPVKSLKRKLFKVASIAAIFIFSMTFFASDLLAESASKHEAVGTIKETPNVSGLQPHVNNRTAIKCHVECHLHEKDFSQMADVKLLSSVY